MIWLGKKQPFVNPPITLGDGLIHQLIQTSSVYYRALSEEELTTTAERVFSSSPVQPIITDTQFWETMLDTNTIAPTTAVHAERPVTYETYFGTFSIPHE